MPKRPQKSVSVPKVQHKAIESLVNEYPHIAGRTVTEFYITAAAERLVRLYDLLKIAPKPSLDGRSVGPD